MLAKVATESYLFYLFEKGQFTLKVESARIVFVNAPERNVIWFSGHQIPASCVRWMSRAWQNNEKIKAEGRVPTDTANSMLWWVIRDSRLCLWVYILQIMPLIKIQMNINVSHICINVLKFGGTQFKVSPWFNLV